MAYVRPHATRLARRLAEPRRFIQAVAGPRQVGKTTLVQRVVENSGLQSRFASADEPTRSSQIDKIKRVTFPWEMGGSGSGKEE
jgi:predicted AAA+ superfamily ATPase